MLCVIVRFSKRPQTGFRPISGNWCKSGEDQHRQWGGHCRKVLQWVCVPHAHKQLPYRCKDFARDMDIWKTVQNVSHSSGKRSCETCVHPVECPPAFFHWPVARGWINRWGEYFHSLCLYYYFLECVLPKFTDLNKYFQSEKMVITSLKSKVCETQKAQTTKHAALWCKSDAAWPAVTLTDFHAVRCQNFLWVACGEIKKRFDLMPSPPKSCSCPLPLQMMPRHDQSIRLCFPSCNKYHDWLT